MSNKGMQNISSVQGTYKCNTNTDVMLIFLCLNSKHAQLSSFNLSFDLGLHS